MAEVEVVYARTLTIMALREAVLRKTVIINVRASVSKVLLSGVQQSVAATIIMAVVNMCFMSCTLMVF